MQMSQRDTKGRLLVSVVSEAVRSATAEAKFFASSAIGPGVEPLSNGFVVR